MTGLWRRSAQRDAASAEVRAVEAELQWHPLLQVPPSMRAAVDQAGQFLVAHVRHRDPDALQKLVETLDGLIADRQFPFSAREFRVDLLNRAGIAHEEASSREPTGDMTQTAQSNIHLDIAIKLLRRGILESDEELPAEWRLCTNLARALTSRYQERGDPTDLDEAVGAAQRGARLSAGGSPAGLAQTALANALRARHRHSGGAQDLDQAVRASRTAVSEFPEGLLSNYFHYVLADMLQHRYDVTGELADLDEAGSLLRRCLASPHKLTESIPREVMQALLGSVLRRRFVRTRSSADLDEAIALMQSANVAGNPVRLTNLGNALLDRYLLLLDIHDLQSAVHCQEESLRLTVAGDWQLASRHNNAGRALTVAARAIGDADLAFRAAQEYRASLKLTLRGAPERASREYNLAGVLQKACGKARDGPEVEECRRVYADAVRHGADGSLEWGGAAAAAWGRWAATRENWSEASDAYLRAMELIEQLYRSQLTRDHKETWLADTQSIPGEAAYALAKTGRPDDAVDALERGRALILSESLNRDHNDLGRLEHHDKKLVERFRTSTLEVEQASRSAWALQVP